MTSGTGRQDACASTRTGSTVSRTRLLLFRLAREHGDALAFFGLLAGLTWVLGYRLTVPFDYFQLLDRAVLRDRLLESIGHLHSQPPLLNLVLGLALKLSVWVGVAPESLLLLVQLLAGAVSVVALSALARHLLGDGLARRAALALVLLDPMLYLATFQWFYTLHELTWLAVAALLARRYLADGRPRSLLGAALALVLLSNERSLFHPLFSLIAIVLLVILRSRWVERGVGLPRRGVAVVALSIPLLFAWPLKNLVQVGVFSPSSWQGLNISSGLGISLPRPMTIFLSIDTPDRPELEAAMRTLVPSRLAGVPAVASLYKSEGSPNWNHLAIVSLSRESLERASAVVREHPELLFEKVLTGYVCGYALSTGRDLRKGSLDVRIHGEASRIWVETYERLLLLRRPDDAPSLPIVGFTLLFPLAMGLAALRAYRESHGDAVVSGTAVFMAWPVAWVVLMVLFVEGHEGSRLRLSTEPFVLLLAVWGVTALIPSRRGERARRVPR